MRAVTYRALSGAGLDGTPSTGGFITGNFVVCDANNICASLGPRAIRARTPDLRAFLMARRYYMCVYAASVKKCQKRLSNVTNVTEA